MTEFIPAVDRRLYKIKGTGTAEIGIIVNHAFRHSGATQVSVTIEPVANIGRAAAARVRVSDNGKGLPPDHRLGLGLTGMRERVMALGGTMTVTSASGVTVEATIPCGAGD